MGVAVHVCGCVCAYKHVYVNMCVHESTCTRGCILMQRHCNIKRHTQIYTPEFAQNHAFTPTHIHTFTFTRIHTLTRMCMYTQFSWIWTVICGLTSPSATSSRRLSPARSAPPPCRTRSIRSISRTRKVPYSPTHPHSTHARGLARVCKRACLACVFKG